MNKRLVLLIPLMIAASLLVPAAVIPRAHALTGLVCLTNPPTLTTCPSGAPNVTAPAVGQNVTFGVFVQGSDAMGGFDVYVQNNPAFLQARAITMGTMIPTASQSLTSICINGSPQTGSCTVNTANGPGVVEATTIDGSGNNECGGIGPCGGLAFSIIYTVVATPSPSSPLTYPSAGGCSNTSVAGTTDCVLIADAFGNALAENIQAAQVTGGAAATSLVAVVSGTDGNLYWSPFVSPAWGAWSPLAGQSPSSPSLCASSATTSELVVRGNDNSIYHKTFTSGSPGSFQATWDKNPTGVTDDSPVCQVIGTTMYVVVRGATNELYATTFDLTARTWAATWTDLLGASSSTPALVATPAVPRLDLVVRGTDNGIYNKAFTGGAWAAAWGSSNRQPTPDRTIASPAIVSDGTQIHVVVVGTESNIWYATLSFAGAWSTYTSLNGAASVAPALTIDSASALHLVVRGFDAQMYSKSKPSGGAWDTAWVNAGGVLASGPAAVATGTSVNVLVQGVDNTIWYNTLTGATWSGFVTTNGQTSRGASISTP